MNAIIHIDDAYVWISRFIAVYVIFDSAEKISIHREFKKERTFDWQQLRKANFFASRPRISALLSYTYAYPNWLILLGIRALCSIGLLLDTMQLPSLSILAFTGLLLNLRNYSIGTETQNRMGLMIIITLFIHALFSGEIIAFSALLFIALQSCFSYFTAGFSKLRNIEWQKGTGLYLATDSFLQRNTLLIKMLNWSVIAIECSFPLVLAGQPFLYFFLGWGVLFHLIIAIVLRINFIWVWLASYPAIIYIAQQWTAP
ncbi:MAG: hypothetical protein ACKOXB_06205 [Flavobacteriales bacterium]